jgi:hypothetical protein
MGTDGKADRLVLIATEKYQESCAKVTRLISEIKRKLEEVKPCTH